jgi:hypothetical protein
MVAQLGIRAAVTFSSISFFFTTGYAVRACLL